MRIINKETGKEKIFTSRQQILLNLLAPVKEEFSFESNTFNDILEKYKDVELTDYKPTAYELKRMEEDADFALDIPTKEVKGYDDEISGSRFDEKIRDEFFERFMNHDKKLYAFINSHNNNFKVEF